MTTKSLKNDVKMRKIFACGAKKLKNEVLGVYFLYKQAKIGAEGAENFGKFLTFNKKTPLVLAAFGTRGFFYSNYH